MTNLEIKTALLLDDNLMSSARIVSQLKNLGYAVRVADKVPSHEEAPDFAPQLILLHLGSRHLDGVTLIPELQKRFPHARLAGFCGHREIEIRRAAKAAGIARIFTNDEAFLDLAKALA